MSFLPMILHITIDTNLINARQKLPEMNVLEDMHKRGSIEIVKTDAMDTEMLEGYRKGLEKSQQYREIQGYGVFGHSRFDHSVYGSVEDGGLTQSIVMALFPGKSCSELSDNDIRDVMHIQAHVTHKGDYFITEDKIILAAADSLVRLDVRVRTPKELLKEIA
jgi:hypothetical protein